MKRKETKEPIKEETNVCLKCGRPIAKNEKFCLSCGFSLNVRSGYPHNLL